MGHTKLLKLFQRQIKWTEKGIIRHKHDFNLHCVMILQRGVYNTYFDVMKCRYCNSFECISREGSLHGLIDETEVANKLKRYPHLYYSTSHPNLITFKDLQFMKFEARD